MPLNHPNQAIHPIDEIYRRGDEAAARIVALQRQSYIGVKVHPELLNGWFTDIAGETPYTYCLLLGRLFHDEGTIDGGASGSVAYIVPELWRPRSGNIHWHGHVIGASVAGARFDMDSTTGEVSVTF